MRVKTQPKVAMPEAVLCLNDRFNTKVQFSYICYMVFSIIVNGEVVHYDTNDFGSDEQYVCELLLSTISYYEDELIEQESALKYYDDRLSYLELLSQPKHNQN